MGLQLSRTLQLVDQPQDWSTFALGGTDRVDVHAKGNPVAVELRAAPSAPWSEQIVIDVDDFESISGLALAYRPRGVAAFRLFNANAGQAAVAVVRAYSVG